MECELCNKQVSENSETHRVWHNDCFKCKECGKQLSANFECHDGILYCTQRCYKMFTSKSITKHYKPKEKFPYNPILLFSANNKNMPSWIPHSKTHIPQEAIPKKYEVRLGVINLGPEYEYKMAALLSLRLISNNLEEFWLASNVRNVGAFDDIVLYTKMQDNDATTYMIQLKHQENPKNIDRQAFLDSSGDFSVSKYSSDIENLSETASNKVFFVIYTNRDVDNHCILQTNSDDTFKFLETHSRHSKRFTFNFSKLRESTSMNLSEQYQQAILLFANQASVKQLDQEIWCEVHSIFKSKRINVESIAKNFTLYVTNWARGNLDGHYLLTKEEVHSKLFHLYFTQFQIRFNELAYYYICDDKFSLWKEIIGDKVTTVVDNTDDLVICFLMDYISSEVRQYCDENVPFWSTILSQNSRDIFYTNNPELSFLMSKICGNKTQMTLIDIYQCLCILKVLPLILQVNKPEELADLLKIKQDSFRVVILSNGLVTNGGFSSLTNLSVDHCRKILSRPFVLQGRKAILADCIDESLYEYVKCCDIIKILSGAFSIGQCLTPLPESFVDICVTKTFLKKTVTETCDVFVIDDCINELYTDDKPVHYLSSYDSDHFLWRYSIGSTKNLDNYMVEIGYDLKNGIDDRYFFDQVVLVSAPPGMGKSMLMTYVAQNVPTNKWVIRVDLNDHQQYFKSEYCVNESISAWQHLRYFKENNHSPLHTAIYNNFVARKDVVVLLDGFDEISITHKEAVTNIAKSFQNEHFQVWLTTRPVMKKHLEEEFKTRSISLKPFTASSQLIFLTKYFYANNPDLDIHYIEEFASKLIRSAKNQLNNSGEDFTGIPLQITLLGNVFNDDCRKYVISQGACCFNENFDLLYLYQNFVDKKLNMLYEKFGGAALDARALFTEHHCQFALRVLFPTHLLKELEDKKALDGYYKIKESKMLLMQREGIIVIDENFVINFTHRTYAEYLAANWIANNLIQKTKLFNLALNLHRQRFTDAYKFLFRIFDQIVAHNSPLHVSIINGRVTKVPCDNYTTDLIGRNVLHLASLYNPQFPIRNYLKHPTIDFQTNENVLEILQINKELFQTDLLGYNPLDYALENRALSFAEQICSNLSVVVNIKVALCLQYLEYCAYFNYGSLFKVLLPFSIRNDVLLKYNDSQSLLDYCGFYLKYNPALLNNFAELQDDVFNVDPWDIVANKNDSNTLVHYAVLHNKRDIILNNIDDLDASNDSGNTPLDFALACGNNDLAKLLISKGASSTIDLDVLPSKISTNISHHWILDKIACDLLIKHKSTNYIGAQDNYGNTPLHCALKWNKFDVANLLIAMEADVSIQNTIGETPLHIAALKGLSDFLKKLSSSSYSHINIKNYNCDTPLHLAVTNGKIDAVKVLISNGANANVTDASGNIPLHYVETPALAQALIQISNIDAQNNLGDTPLHLAAFYNKTNILSMLVKHKANVNIQNMMGETPLHLATRVETVEILTNSGADIWIQNISGATPLHNADVEVIQFLYNEHNINQPDFEGNTPLHLACYSGRLSAIDELIKKGADWTLRNVNGRTPFHCGVEAGFVTRLLDDIDNPDLNGNTALHLVSNLDVLNHLIANSADINVQNANGSTPLHCAVTAHHLEIVKRLCELTSLEMPDHDGNTALHLAVQTYNYDIINVLIGKGADINKRNKIGKTPLYYAPDIELVRHLIEHGTLVNIQDSNGNTPLHTASFYGKTEIISLLLDQGVGIDCKNKSGRTPLHFASAEGQIESVNLLLHNNALINSHTSIGNTALHLAVWDLTLIETLISSGAIVNAINNNGETPLHLACYQEYFDSINILLEKGADVNKQDKSGNTPLHLVGDYEIVELLIEHDASITSQNLKGETTLHLCTNGETANLLISMGASIEAQTDTGDTPLHYAANSGRTNIVNVLLTNGAILEPLNNEGKTPLHYAYQTKSYEIIDTLIQAGADINKLSNMEHFDVNEYLLTKNVDFKRETLHQACLGRSYMGLKQLLEAGLNINLQDDDGNTPLHVSLSGDYLMWHSDLLVISGADVNIPNNNGDTCIHLAAAVSIKHFNLLLNNATDINVRNNLGQTPLHIAAKCAETYNLRQLIVKQAEINAETYEGETPLFYASDANVYLLLDKGANVNHYNNKGNTALHQAIAHNKNNNVSRLLARGADINAKNNIQQTPLHFASVWNNEYLVWLLLNSGADVNAQDMFGNSALHIACAGGFYYCAAHLIDSGANINMQNNRGNTPTHYSMSVKGYYTLIELLVTAGADINIKNDSGRTPLETAIHHEFVTSTKILESYSGLTE